VKTRRSATPDDPPVTLNTGGAPVTQRGSAAARGAAPSISIRPLTSHGELNACVAMQRRIWGKEYDVVPSSLIKVVTRIGGLAAGAFDDRDFLGFVLGITGVEHGAVVHWSHMLAVAPEAQNHGIGHALKDYQRAYAREIGAQAIYWTFDPLVARNAHFNLNVLGVRVTRYVPDMYGESTSPLHRGIGTDRFIVSWPLEDAALAARRQEIAWAHDRDATSRGDGAEKGDVIRMEVPYDIALLQSSDMPAALGWRARTRATIQDALTHGFTIQGFRRGTGGSAKNGYYVLERTA
jgi:predicted GNAT superfamily acetyltransferase